MPYNSSKCCINLEKEKFMKTKIVVGYPGVGKTYLGKTFSDVVDIDSSDYHWIYDNPEVARDLEKRKDCMEKSLNDSWPYNYIEAISDLYHQDEFSYILVVFKTEILSLLSDCQLPFTIVAPKRELKEEYRKRYVERKNTDRYISRMLSEWDRDMEYIENFSNVYYLDSCEHLSDFVAFSCAEEMGQGYCKKKV